MSNMGQVLREEGIWVGMVDRAGGDGHGRDVTSTRRREFIYCFLFSTLSERLD